MLVALYGFGLIGCGEPAPPPAPEPEACTLSFDTLAGQTFVRQERTPDGKDYKEDTWARARFYKDGAALKVKYNTRALVEMYDYTCKKGKGEILCQADNPDLQQWCQTLIANKGSCSPAELADVTGVPVDQAQKAQAELTAKMSKLKPDELARMKVAFNNPNNQLRGLFHVKINADECRITARDTYQTMTDGQIREVDNFVGSSRFVKSDKDLVFEKCSDHQSFVALTAPDAKAKPGETKLNWKVGETIPFKYVGEALSKPAPGCTYTMDTYSVYEPVDKGVAVEPGADGTLAWKLDRAFPDHGKKVVHLYRYEACNGAAPALKDVSCAMVEVAP
ncbi:MAG: hypothetical protein ABMB14_28020 [Myxococcota bacterium]